MFPAPGDTLTNCPGPSCGLLKWALAGLLLEEIHKFFFKNEFYNVLRGVNLPVKIEYENMIFYSYLGIW